MKNILVTGVSRGLGLEITRKLLHDDMRVIGISRNVTDSLLELTKPYGDRFIHIPCDLKNSEETIAKIFGTPDGMDNTINGFVNNAATAYDDLITNLNLNRLVDMYSTNVFTPMMIVKYVIRDMLFHGTKGSIVHISSVSAHTGYKGLSMYASTKGALEAFSKNTAREWGERGIRSNVIVSGFMETDMSGTLSTEQKQRIHKRTSLKMPTDPQSVASMVSFLVSDASNSVTGSNVFVDSGTI